MDTNDLTLLRTQVTPKDSKWTQNNPNESKLTHMTKNYSKCPDHAKRTHKSKLLKINKDYFTLSMPVPAQTPGSTPPTAPNITVNHLIYADDLVCIAPSEIQLQSLIDIVNLWCCKFRIEANLLKTEILHVRKPLKSRSNFKF